METTALYIIVALLVVIAFLAGQVIRREPRPAVTGDRYGVRLQAQQKARQWAGERLQTVEEQFVSLNGRSVAAWVDSTDNGAEKPAPESKTKPVRPADPPKPGRWSRIAPHVKPLLYALGGALIWAAMVAYYNHLSRYLIPAEDALGDFRILFLKKSVGAALPVLSGVAVAVLAFFMLIPKIYTYINGWTAKDFDLISDLKDPDRPGARVRLLFFAFFFALFYLSYLKFFPLSIQDLTL